MAIDEYYRDIIVLAQIEGQDQLGGRIENWGEVATIQGAINKSYANVSNIGGKSGETSAAKGFFEITDTSTSYLHKQNRLQDIDGSIYKINGEPKNTMNRNHHYRLDLEYVTHING